MSAKQDVVPGPDDTFTLQEIAAAYGTTESKTKQWLIALRCRGRNRRPPVVPQRHFRDGEVIPLQDDLLDAWLNKHGQGRQECSVGYFVCPRINDREAPPAHPDRQP